MLLDHVPVPLIRVIDDDPEVLRAMDFMLTCEGYNVRLYNSAAEFLAEDCPSDFGCIIADVRMPDMSGIELFYLLRLRNYPVPLLFLSGHGDVEMAVDAMLHGAVDFIEKPIRNDRIFRAIERAIEQSRRRLDSRELGTPEEERFRYDTLTPREKDVMLLVAQGLMNKDVAERLGLSVRTVEIYRAGALRKLGVKTPAEIARLLTQIRQE